MINPQTLDLQALPWLPLDACNAFPQQSAIYFAIAEDGTVQYIGRSINPKQRWGRHHKYEQLSKIGGIRIAYLFTDADLLPAVELALIRWFNPPLNSTGKPGSWGETKQRVNVMLTPTAIDLIDSVADEMGVTRSEVLERLSRSESLKASILAEIVGGLSDE